MSSWLHAVVLAGAVTVTAPASTRGHPDIEARHEFHVSYTRMAVEPLVISAQIRVFADDVTRVLIERSRAQSLTLNSPQADAAFQRYLVESFPVHANGRLLTPVIVSSSQDKEMWAFIVTWTSATPITSLSMHNAALFEIFGDQQNIVKVKHIPSSKESTLFYSGGSRADQVLRF